MIEWCVWIDAETGNAVAFQHGLVGEESAVSKYRIRHENTVYYVMSKGVVYPAKARSIVHALVEGRSVTRSFQDIWERGF